MNLFKKSAAQATRFRGDKILSMYFSFPFLQSTVFQKAENFYAQLQPVCELARIQTSAPISCYAASAQPSEKMAIDFTHRVTEVIQELQLK